MNTGENLKDYQRVRTLAIRSLFEIIEQSSEGTVIVDRDANIVWMNERYARRFGLESAAVAIGKACESVIPGSLLRVECAAIFAIFTSQAWNLAFSLYQSLRTTEAANTSLAESFKPFSTSQIASGFNNARFCGSA